MNIPSSIASVTSLHRSLAMHCSRKELSGTPSYCLVSPEYISGPPTSYRPQATVTLDFHSGEVRTTCRCDATGRDTAVLANHCKNSRRRQSRFSVHPNLPRTCLSSGSLPGPGSRSGPGHGLVRRATRAVNSRNPGNTNSRRPSSDI